VPLQGNAGAAAMSASLVAGLDRPVADYDTWAIAPAAGDLPAAAGPPARRIHAVARRTAPGQDLTAVPAQLVLGHGDEHQLWSSEPDRSQACFPAGGSFLSRCCRTADSTASCRSAGQVFSASRLTCPR
jgi:hypothetical protein